MSLLRKASIVTTPTAYENGKILSVKPNTSVGDFDFTRNSSATRVNSQGLIEDMQTLSGELVSNGDFSQGSQDWSVTGSDANNYVVFNGSTARLKFLNTSPVTQLTTSFVMTAGKKYKLTVDVLTVTSGGIKIDGNGISETFNTSGITTRIINPTAASAINFYRATANVDITLNSVSLIEITEDTNLPRIDYTGGVGHWLFEPQSTNLITYSSDFIQSTWFKQSGGVASAPIVTSNYSISPDGSLNADRIIFNINGGTASSDLSQLTDPVTASIGSVSNSVYIKSNTTSNYTMSFVNAFGSVISIAVTTEWQRFEVNATTTTTAAQFKLRLRGSESTSDFADVSVWGAQLEESSFATSIIPTEGAIKTRLADAAFGAGSSDLINSTEGVLYAEVAALANDGTTRIISLSDNTSSNRILIKYDNIVNRLEFFVIVGGAGQYSFITIVDDSLSNNKIAFKYKENDFAIWANGFELDTDTVGITPTGLSELAFDDGGGGSDFYGKTKCVAVFKEALTDAELTCLTTI